MIAFSQSISGSTRPIFTIFLPNEYLYLFGICSTFIDPDIFFRFLKSRCHGNLFLAKLANWPSFNMLEFRNGSEYRNSDLQLLNGNIFLSFDQDRSTGPVTPEITSGESVTYGMKLQKSAYLEEYFSKYWRIFKFSALVNTCME